MCLARLLSEMGRVSNGTGLIPLLQALADHGGDAVSPHGDPVQAVGDLHGAFLVGDDQQLGALPQFLIDRDQTSEMSVVKGSAAR